MIKWKKITQKNMLNESLMCQDFILTAFQNIIQVNKIFAKVNISILLHFIKIVAALTVFVTINSTISHIYRDICSGSTHCYKHYTVILSCLGVGVCVCVCHFNTHFANASLDVFVFFLFFLLSIENYLQFGSMQTAQMWKAVIVQRLSKKLCTYFCFCLKQKSQN